MTVFVQITQGKVAYVSEMEDGKLRHLTTDSDITAGTWHNVTLIVSGNEHVCLTLFSLRFRCLTRSDPLVQVRRRLVMGLLGNCLAPWVELSINVLHIVRPYTQDCWGIQCKIFTSTFTNIGPGFPFISLLLKYVFCSFFTF